MRVFLACIVLLTGMVAAWVAWGPLPGGRIGLWMLQARVCVHPRSAETTYRLAEQHFQLGDFEKALILSKAAVDSNPRHAPALALRTEVLFILGMGKATPSDIDYSSYMRNSHWAADELLVEIDAALERAECLRFDGDPDNAMIEVRRALEFLKWMPEGDELVDRKRRATSLSAFPR
jgi:hypothetical protein